MMHAVDVIAEVRARLEATGGVRELQHLARFSTAELDLLVRLERGMSPPILTEAPPVPSWRPRLYREAA